MIAEIHHRKMSVVAIHDRLPGAVLGFDNLHAGGVRFLGYLIERVDKGALINRAKNLAVLAKIVNGAFRLNTFGDPHASLRAGQRKKLGGQ